MRVLASAYACEPGSGSEPGVGWNWVLQLSRFHEVWVLTRSNNEPSISRGMAVHPLPNVHWVYFDLPRWLRFWKRGTRGARLYYYLWQLGAYFRALPLHRAIRFEVIHHVTFVNYWMPSFLSLLNAPFVWGPVGGGESAPADFIKELSWRARVYERARNLARRCGHLDPFVRLTARRARRTFCTTEQTLSRVKQLGSHNAAMYSDAGLSTLELQGFQCCPKASDSTYRVISMGRLLHWKGFDLGLRAFAAFCHETKANATYEIIGDGPEALRLKQLAESLGIRANVKFRGKLKREEALTRLANAAVLLHPSLHDSGGWVCLEAMAAKVPVICLDLGGPAVQVTSETGIKIKASSPRQAADDIATALRDLYLHPEERCRFGNKGAERVRESFHWDVKGTWMNQVYQNLYVER